MNRISLRVGSGLLAGALAAACSSESQDSADAEDGNLDVARSAVTTSMEYRDASGKLRMTIKTCDWVGTTSGASPTKQNQATCEADVGWRMVGGGAEIENQPATGAYLLASAPDVNFGRSETTWGARSKGPAAHRLRAYVIQLKLEGVDATSSDIVVQADSEGPPSTRPTYQMSLGGWPQESFIFLGGGASLMPPDLTPNGALTDIVPSDTGSEWSLYVRGTMFGGTTGTIKAYTFGLRRCPSAWGGSCIQQESRSVDGTASSGYSTVSNTSKWPGVMLGVGAVALRNGSGKFLTDIIPFNGTAPGVTVRSYTNGGTDTAAARSYLLNYWVEGSPQSYNVLNFATSGALYRSGTTLQQYGFSNSDQHKWHLEPIPNNAGRYLLRNGNPGHGGDCAYRSGTTVRIGTTCAGAAYQWQTQRGNVTNGAFSLKNVESSACLDANLNGLNTSTPRNVVLKACSTSGEWQDLFVSQYGNWPPPL